jgi:hypothetical protein
MSSSVNEVALRAPRAVAAEIHGARLRLTVADGREISVPIDRFEFLEGASEAERADLRIIGNGRGIWCEQLEDGVSVPLLFGLPMDG